MSDARVAVSWRRCQNTYFTIQETLEARLHRLSGVKVPKATGVLWPTKFILTVPLLARLSGMDGARADTWQASRTDGAKTAGVLCPVYVANIFIAPSLIWPKQFGPKEWMLLSKLQNYILHTYRHGCLSFLRSNCLSYYGFIK